MPTAETIIEESILMERSNSAMSTLEELVALAVSSTESAMEELSKLHAPITNTIEERRAMARALSELKNAQIYAEHFLARL